ncbi:parvin gamma [Pitangus sulphuratus]|nr:parvin gamma [Pitangus sulphuratus]
MSPVSRKSNAVYQEREKTMDSDFLNVFTQPSTLDRFLNETVIAKGEKRKLIKPTSSNNPKLEQLKLLLIDWINRTLKEEHIVVKSLEEDLYDGLVLHHLLEKLGSLKLDVDKIALTEKKQRQKLSVIMEAVAKCLQLEESQLKWSVESILTKDLLSTLHLLVAIAQHFDPSLALPPNVQVETITIENTSRGLKTSNAVENITDDKENTEAQSNDAFDELFSRAPDKLEAVKKVFLQFVNQHLGKLGLSVKDIESQLHNVNLALDLLADGGLLNFSVNSEVALETGEVKTETHLKLKFNTCFGEVARGRQARGWIGHQSTDPVPALAKEEASSVPGAGTFLEGASLPSVGMFMDAFQSSSRPSRIVAQCLGERQTPPVGHKWKEEWDGRGHWVLTRVFKPPFDFPGSKWPRSFRLTHIYQSDNLNNWQG